MDDFERRLNNDNASIASSYSIAIRKDDASLNELYPDAADPRLDRFLGLHQPWVPLRKVKKDDALRFLAPAELLTPVLWNTTFLNDTVVMKAGNQHRLYITQPEAYLQHRQDINFHGLNSCWTWQRIREMDRVYPDSQSSDGSSGVLEADAFEECWQFNQKLDDTANSRLSSVDPHHSHEKDVSISRTTVASSEQYFTAASNPDTSMASPVMARGETPSTHSGRKGSLPPHQRATGGSPEQIRKSRSVQSNEDDDEAMRAIDDHSSSSDSFSGISDEEMTDNDSVDGSVYKDKPDILDDLAEAAQHFPKPRGPEDIPRPGVEDDLFDGNLVDNQEKPEDSDDDDGDDTSSTASAPSVYPSHPPPSQLADIGDGREMTRALEDDDDYDDNVAHDFVIREDSDKEAERPEAQNLF
ncbi:hypothetical protein SLS53_003419 [Cytospora paraplurivora]|uniref:Uncharacterized protein n=1 Tax=Cytospora paraplurivora TaxID=2898453 RepID=A0AAN9UA79_9PEZI